MKNILILHCCYQQLLVTVQTKNQLFSQSSQNIRGQSELVFLAIDNVLQRAGIELSAIDILGFTNGPGSFSGIRMGICVAQAFNMAFHMPLIPVSTLAVLVRSLALTKPQLKAEITVVIDAKMGELYRAEFHLNSGKVHRVSADTTVPVTEFKVSKNTHYIGDGCAILPQLESNKILRVEVSPLAVITEVEALFASECSVQDCTNIQPVYLRQENAWVPNKNVLINE